MQVLPSLLSGLKAVCSTFPDTRKGRGGNIEIADFGLSAFAMFFMQSASFLAFQRALEKGQGRSNGQTLFGIGRIPSDNYIRDTLDEADPMLLRPCFERIVTLLAGPALRQAFGRLGGRPASMIFLATGFSGTCSFAVTCHPAWSANRTAWAPGSTASAISWRCSAIASVLQKGMTRLAALPSAGQMAPKI